MHKLGPTGPFRIGEDRESSGIIWCIKSEGITRQHMYAESLMRHGSCSEIRERPRIWPLRPSSLPGIIFTINQTKNMRFIN
ncbi:unnamed protein product [Ectocarpus sp. 12 AP-2014]